MAEFEYSLDEFAKMISSGKLPRELKQKFIDATKRGVDESLSTLKAESPKDTGEYSESWIAQKIKDGVIVGNISDHAKEVEFGDADREPTDFLRKQTKQTIIPNVKSEFKKVKLDKKP